MALKDNIRDDIKRVFFNEDDFAETAIFEGVEITVVEDPELLLSKTDISPFGLSLGEKLLFVQWKDLPRMPQTGDRIEYKDKQWFVRQAEGNFGVVQIRMGREQQFSMPY
jgi:hypothetical protein